MVTRLNIQQQSSELDLLNEKIFSHRIIAFFTMIGLSATLTSGSSSDLALLPYLYLEIFSNNKGTFVFYLLSGDFHCLILKNWMIVTRHHCSCLDWNVKIGREREREGERERERKKKKIRSKIPVFPGQSRLAVAVLQFPAASIF